jgi:hypothetical protein
MKYSKIYLLSCEAISQCPLIVTDHVHYNTGYLLV